MHSDATETIYIEVKCFTAKSDRDELYKALGQYSLYADVLDLRRIVAPLYLALPERTCRKLINDVLRQTLQRLRVKIVFVDMTLEEVKQWIEF